MVARGDKARTERPYLYAELNKADRIAARRADFVEAGIALMGSAGAAKTTVRAVCRRAGHTERYFYASFPGVDGFLTAVVETVATRTVLRVAEATLREQDPHAQIRAGLTEVVRTLHADPGIGRILLVETIRAGGSLTDLRANLLTGAALAIRLWFAGGATRESEAMIIPLLARFQRGAGVGEVLLDARRLTATTTADTAAVAMAGATAEVLVAWLDQRITPSPDQLVEYLIHLFDQTVGSPATVAAR